MASTTPSRIASIMASRSAAERSGGHILRWCCKGPRAHRQQEVVRSHLAGGRAVRCAGPDARGQRKRPWRCGPRAGGRGSRANSVTRRMSRSTMEDSASAGMPRNPSLNDIGPRFMLARSVIRVSSACWIHAQSTRAAAARVSRIDVVLQDGPPIVGDSHCPGGLQRRIVVDRLAL